jgi:hypothetical protein
MNLICRNCGLVPGEEDLAGCTRDTINRHEFVADDSRPYKDLEMADILERYGRARIKARSSARTADHMRRCPEGGPTAWETWLYEHKTIKRTRLGDLLWKEVMLRTNDRRNRRTPVPSTPDDEPTHDLPFHLDFDPDCYACRWAATQAVEQAKQEKGKE